MPEEFDQSRLMRQFLLDNLDLEDREQIEERFLVEHAFREKLLIAEESLIEDYLDGALDHADRDKFNSLFSSSPVQREKLAIARAIRAAAKAETGRVSTTVDLAKELSRREVSSESDHRMRYSSRSAVIIAVAVLIVISVTLWVILRNQPVHQTAEERTPLATQAELAELNSGSRSGSELNPAETESLVLAPINPRSSGPPTLSRRAGISVFELWLVPASVESATFKAAVTKDEAPGKFEISSLPLMERAQGRVVRLRIPAHLLDAGTYQIQLTAVEAKGDSAYAGEYRFQVGH